jgi:hypothetical protein
MTLWPAAKEHNDKTEYFRRLRDRALLGTLADLAAAMREFL